MPASTPPPGPRPARRALRNIQHSWQSTILEAVFTEKATVCNMDTCQPSVTKRSTTMKDLDSDLTNTVILRIAHQLSFCRSTIHWQFSVHAMTLKYARKWVGCPISTSTAL